jgi:sugar O-acyltransferase (sialic acid O-acetyltransferase NeuD family)
MVIIGAKGLAKEILTILSWNGEDKELYFFDNANDDIQGLLYSRFPIIKTWDALCHHFAAISKSFILGIGAPEARELCAREAMRIGGQPKTLLSRSALIGKYGNLIGAGVTIMSQATITSDVSVGRGTLVNKNVILSHDTVVGEYCHVAPGARILGRARVGDKTQIGANAVILPDIIVGSNCCVGAGAVVTKNVPNGRTVVGVPAHEVTNRNA